MDQGQGHLVRPAERRRPRRQRWCLRLQAHQPVPLPVHGVLRQPAIVQGRQGVRLLLQDSVHEGHFLLRPHGDGDHHRHELLPRVQVPLRPQRHGVRQARQARPQRQAPPLRHHRHRVHQGAVRVPGPEDRVPRGGVLEPRLLRGAGGVRGRRRRRGAGGPHGVPHGARPGHRQVDADARILGLHLAPGHQPPPAGALLHPHPQRVRQDARRQGRHPGQLEAQHLLPLLRAVQLRADASIFDSCLQLELALTTTTLLPLDRLLLLVRRRETERLVFVVVVVLGKCMFGHRVVAVVSSSWSRWGARFQVRRRMCECLGERGWHVMRDPNCKRAGKKLS